MSLSAVVVFDPTVRWRLNERVSLRDEEFGALAYHHGTRRLVFLKSRELVDLVRRLEHFESVDAAVVAMVPPALRGHYAKALASLATSEIIRED
ncbi:MAG: mycofactocin biosynthesis chaperone MftB [Acidimicrobiales bacterium]